jgi:hypothetical protein
LRNIVNLETLPLKEYLHFRMWNFAIRNFEFGNFDIRNTVTDQLP